MTGVTVLARPRWDFWTDALVAGGLFAAITTDVALNGKGHELTWPEIVVIMALTWPLAGRRRAPLAYAAVVMVMALVLAGPLGQADTNVFPVYAAFVPAYTVAAYENPGRARWGLAMCLPGVAILALLLPRGGGISGILLGVGVCVGSWVVGRWMNDRNILADELQSKIARLSDEGQDRRRLAVADEQTRIARALHEAVAERVATMVVEAAATQTMLHGGAELAEEAMEAIECSGRAVMTEMRRLLGVLRATEETATLAPQPGVGQIHALLDRTGTTGGAHRLLIEGEPGPLPPSVDLALYRVVEEALDHGHGDLQVVITFGEAEVELKLTTTGGRNQSRWPTPAMCERVALCAGSISSQDLMGRSHQLAVCLPRPLEGALA